MTAITAADNVVENGSGAVKSPSLGGSFNALKPLLLHDPFFLLMFFSLLTLGSDELAIRMGGMTLKIVFPILMTAFAALYMRQSGDIAFDRQMGLLFLLWALAGLASTFHSYQPIKSLGYTTWVLFNFFIIIGLGYNLARSYGPKIAFALWFFVFRIHTALIFLELLFGILRGVPVRPSLWFYEPSYLAIFMTAYFGAALYMFLRNGRGYRLDFVLSSLAMLLIVSATAMLGALLAIALNILVAKQRIKLLLWSSSIIAIFLGTLYAFFQGTSYYTLVAGFLFGGGDIVQLILSRGGNRVIRAYIGWQAFLQHPLLGIGIGADSAYMDQSPIPEQAMPYVKSWTNVADGQPFSNIFIEILGTTGLAGFIPFMGILLQAGYRLFRQLRDNGGAESIAFLMGFFSLLLVLQLESTVLRYYLWAPLGLALGSIVYDKMLVLNLRRGLDRPASLSPPGFHTDERGK